MDNHYSRSYTAEPQHIDELGHVNNAVWVQWVQDLATSHWAAVADPAHVDAYYWVVVRHEIDYRGNISAGESVTARTWLSEMPRGARFNRNVDFTKADGSVIVTAKTSWALIDRPSGRLLRIRADIIEPFMAGGVDGAGGGT